MAIKKQIRLMRIRLALWLMPADVVVRVYDKEQLNNAMAYIQRVVAETTTNLESKWAEENQDLLN